MWTVAIRSIEISAPSLVDLQEQDESLRILDRMNTRGDKWLYDVAHRFREGWDRERARRDAQPIRSPVSESNHRGGCDDHTMLMDFTTTPSGTTAPRSGTIPGYPGVSVPRRLCSALSPVMSRDMMEALRSADFGHPEHPYKNWWQPASQTKSIVHYPAEFGGITERDLQSLSHGGP